MKNRYTIGLYTLVFLALNYFSTDAFGQITFQKIYPTSVTQSGRDVLATSDGGYLIVGLTKPTAVDSDLYVMKTDNIGNILWSKSYGGSNQEYPYALLQTTDGNYFIIGYTSSYGAGKCDTWLVKIDPSGNLLWSKTYGGTEDDFGKGIIATSDGNYMITGRSLSNTPGNSDAFLMKVDPAGNALWTKYYGGALYETSHVVQQCLDGGYIFTGQTYSYGQGAGDIYLVKTNSVGDTTWTKTYGGTGTEDGNYVLQNSDGTYMICAETTASGLLSGLDVQVIKTDVNGNSVWSKLYGGNDKDVSHMMQATSDGGYVITAISRSFGWINPDMWIVKIDVAGNVQWTQHYGSWYHDHCYVVKQTADGGYIVLGHSENSASITQIMFLKLDATGAVAVEELSLNSNLFNVYPSPTDGILKIDFKTFGNEITKFTISNTLGEIICAYEVNPGINHKTIDLKDQQPGIYFISAGTSRYTSTKKIILR